MPLSPDDFFSPIHRDVYAAVTSLPPPDRNLLPVEDVLAERGQLKRVGGPAELTLLSGETTSARIAQYAAERVLEAARERRSIAMADG